MDIAIIGTGNVGRALGDNWGKKEHRIRYGSRKPKEGGVKKSKNISVHSISEAVEASDVILLATPALHTIDVVKSLGDTNRKVIIDAMNIVGGRGPEGYSSTAQAVLDHTETNDVVKCFNTTGANNMMAPLIDGQPLDMFVAGDSKKGKKVAQQLALDLGFANCYDIGGNDKFSMMEEFARFWINLAMFQGMGRDIGFKLLRKK